MRQFLRKRALAAVLSGAVLVGLAQPAVAARSNPTYPVQVTPNGVGDLLIFAYWTTDDDRNSLIAITNAFGGQARRFVHVRFREGVASNEVLNFTICLSPGDVWTAAITPDGTGASSLSVGSPGSCDDDVQAGFGLTPPPAPADPPLDFNADFGYISAYTMECSNALVGGALGLCPGGTTFPTGNDDGGDDTLMGTATLVSVPNGFSSSYNATSLIGFDALNESAAIRNESNTGRAHSVYPNIALGSSPAVILNSAFPTQNSTGRARRDVSNALANEGGVSKEALLGRWTAASGFNSRTDVVLTFPTGDQPGTPDPVSIWIFDEEENLNFSPRSIVLNWEVNICRFQNPSATTSGDTEIICNNNTSGLSGSGSNSVRGPGGTFESGWFRILNNNDLIGPSSTRIVGNVTTNPIAFGDLAIGDGTGVEFDNINAVPDTSFPVIGLLFSFFEGTAGDFDQSYPIQWASITGLGGIGASPFCDGRFITGAGGPFGPYTGCNAFDISSQYQPYTLPNGMVFAPSDTGVGRNRRSDSGPTD